jgi:beta-lactamase regulating signal transducer with metallopeptidase domain
MKAVETLLTHSVIQTVGWALLYSLWQGILISVLLNGALGLLRKSRASTRYMLACIALILMLVLPLWTVWTSNIGAPVATASYSEHKATSSDATVNFRGTSDPLSNFQTEVSVKSWKHRAEQLLETLLPWLITVWLLGVFLCSLRLLGAWAHAQRLKRSQARLILEQWQESVQRLSRQLRVTRPVLLLESSLVRVPTVIGWFRPALLLPTSVLIGLTPLQLETILAHELAHIRRHDYLVNLLQAIIETLLFYHPAVWWVSRRIRVEREHVCDDYAVALSGDALVYARALTKMERLRKASPDFVMAANGGSLMNRVHRLVGVETPPSHRFAGVLSSIAIISALATVGVSARMSLHTSILAHTGADMSVGSDNEGSSAHVPPQLEPSGNTATDASRIHGSKSSNPMDRAVAICSLGRAAEPAAIPFLIRALGDDEMLPAPVGCWDSGSWSPLLRTFHHASPGEEAAMALAAMGASAVDPLIDALRDLDPSVRRNAAWAIGEIRGGHRVDRGRALDPLLASLSDTNGSVRRAAAFSLGEIKDERTAVTLIGELSDGDAGVREMAAWALGEMKASSARDALAVALNDQDKQVRRKARWALAEIQNR